MPSVLASTSSSSSPTDKKVHHLESAKRGGKELDSTSELIPLYKTETDVSFLEHEDDPQMTPDSVLNWLRGSENTGATSNGDSGTTNWKPSLILCSATTEFLKQNKKKRSCRYRSSQAESISRRKGVPHRSPLN